MWRRGTPDLWPLVHPRATSGSGAPSRKCDLPRHFSDKDLQPCELACFRHLLASLDHQLQKSRHGVHALIAATPVFSDNSISSATRRTRQRSITLGDDPNRKAQTKSCQNVLARHALSPEWKMEGRRPAGAPVPHQAPRPKQCDRLQERSNTTDNKTFSPDPRGLQSH